jgi:hypothetical protein
VVDKPLKPKKALKAEMKARMALFKAGKLEGLIGQLDVQATKLKSKDPESFKLKHGWYIKNMNEYPGEQSLFDGDLRELIRNHVLPGHVPPAPMLDETQSVVTLGSCFARELRLFLGLAGVKAARFWIPSGLNNTFAILDFMSWCITGAQTSRGHRYERNSEGEIHEWTPEAEREEYLKALRETGAFVFTLGLSEVWQDRQTGAVFWRGVPRDVYDSDRHVFRLTTVDENAENLRQIVALVRRVNPHAPIVFTLSPIPLLATHRAISCLTADCVSKSVLRVALDLVMADAAPDVYYWPSFEIVKWVGATLRFSAYGSGGSSRNVDRRIVFEIIDSFVEAYYTPEAAERLRLKREAAVAAGAAEAGPAE